jgi:hypothetical protein
MLFDIGRPKDKSFKLPSLVVVPFTLPGYGSGMMKLQMASTSSIYNTLLLRSGRYKY